MTRKAAKVLTDNKDRPALGLLIVRHCKKANRLRKFTLFLPDGLNEDNSFSASATGLIFL